MLKRGPNRTLFIQRIAPILLYGGICIMVISAIAMPLVPIEQVNTATYGLGLGAALAGGGLLYGDYI